MSIKDKEAIIGHTRIQHGKMNDRIYVMDYKHDLDPYFLNQVHLMAKEYDYGKIIAKVPKEGKGMFSKYDFEEEAMIPRLYNGENDCFFMAKYCKEERKLVDDKVLIKSNLNQLEAHNDSEVKPLSNRYKIRRLTTDDCRAMVRIFQNVFKTYPFPIHDQKFIEKTMAEETIYFGVYNEKKLVGISSCEMNVAYENVEMTDFAVLPEHRGKQLAKHLLQRMEEEMKGMGIKTVYTIARSISYPMNVTFSGADYSFGGTLWNNTQISGKIESMNVWHKPLHRQNKHI